MTIFLSGGCKNGKSTLAERAAAVLADGGPLYYVATMIPRDEEDRQRVRRHVRNRAGLGFVTRQWPWARCFEGAEGRGIYLVDSVTALLANEMFAPDGTMQPGGEARTENALLALAERAGGTVFVSDYIQGDEGLYQEPTLDYRRALARIGRTLAACCDTVGEVCAGQLWLYKGAMP